MIIVSLWSVDHSTASFRDVADKFDIFFNAISRLKTFLSESEEVIKCSTENEKRNMN